MGATHPREVFEMTKTTFSRRSILGNATAAALTTVGMSILPVSSVSGAAEQQQKKTDSAPRLPMLAVTNHVMSPESIRKIKGISPQITLITDVKRFDEELPNADV